VKCLASWLQHVRGMVVIHVRILGSRKFLVERRLAAKIMSGSHSTMSWSGAQHLAAWISVPGSFAWGQNRGV
jgi:hypothetical protein